MTINVTLNLTFAGFRSDLVDLVARYTDWLVMDQWRVHDAQSLDRLVQRDVVEQFFEGIEFSAEMFKIYFDDKDD
ncbi:hypothetical protein [Mycobacteroides abscessus]|uniref:hypothetical protein n=1 Tax=Mycobacteroides abscessus TaxID=36809 RepID=UPI0010422A73|nr:hypothetical protein [Mycobacteroides abscessus]